MGLAKPMSYKIEIMDEYSFGQWFSDDLRFATEAEAEECSHHFEGAGWNGILELRIAPSDDAVSARGVLRTPGQATEAPPPAASLKETSEEATRLSVAWGALVDRFSHQDQKT